MTTPRQQASERPISFVLHDMARGTAPVEVPLVIRPEDLTFVEPSRASVTQTLGGAWLDSFGPGIPTLQIAGHTGWGQGQRANGEEQYKELHETVFVNWHRLRAEAVKENLDPDLVRLIFIDTLDSIEWVCMPQNFSLRRSKSRPLLFQYQIALSCLSSDVSETTAALKAKEAVAEGAKKKNGIESLVSSIEKIADSVNRKVTSVLGPVQKNIDKMAALSGKMLTNVNAVVNAGIKVEAAAVGPALSLAKSVTLAASNVYATASSVTTLGTVGRSYLLQVAGALNNAVCLLENTIRPNALLPFYDDLYGSSNCSSTAGGSSISPYDKLNPFEVYQPPRRGYVYVEGENDPLTTNKSIEVSSSAAASLTALNSFDVVLSPMPMPDILAHVDTIANGITFG